MKPILLTTVFGKEIYLIPNASRYGLTKDGELYDFKLARFINWHVSKPPKQNIKNITHGYYIRGIVTDDFNYVGLRRHRALLQVFKPAPDMDKLYVNHINGIPGDDRLDNLEWVTPRDNLIHALKTGLMPNSVIKVDMLDKKTGKVTNFNSVADAAVYLGWTHSKVLHRLNKHASYPDGILFKKNTEKWFAEDKPIVLMGVRRKIVSISDTIKYHATIMHAAKDTGVNTTSITKVARMNNGKPVKGIKFYFEENFHLDCPLT